MYCEGDLANGGWRLFQDWIRIGARICMCVIHDVFERECRLRVLVRLEAMYERLPKTIHCRSEITDRTVILRPVVGRRISRDASDLVGTSWLSSENPRESAWTVRFRSTHRGRFFAQTPALRMTVVESLFYPIMNIPGLFALAQGCASCYTTAAAGGPQTAHALRSGILMLVVPPMVILGGIVVLVKRWKNRSRLPNREN